MRALCGRVGVPLLLSSYRAYPIVRAGLVRLTLLDSILHNAEALPEEEWESSCEYTEGVRPLPCSANSLPWLHQDKPVPGLVTTTAVRPSVPLLSPLESPSHEYT